MRKVKYENLIAFHPGYYIKEIIEDMEITQNEFAKRLDTTDKNLSELLRGETSLSIDIARKLAQMLGTSVTIWLNLQTSYQEKILEIEQKQAFDLEKEYLNSIDYSFFSQKLKVVKDTKDVDDRITQMHKFLKVSSLSVLAKKDFLVACRTAVSDITEKNIINSNAWVQTALNVAEKIDCNPFDGKNLNRYLPEIRRMTLQGPAVFYPRLCTIFQECGVAFVVLPHLKNSGVNGAVKWISADKVLLAINNRRVYADVFWFSLFHEIRHILQKKVKETFITFDKKTRLDDLETKLEQDADKFSSNYLIPEDQYSAFITNGSFSENSIRSFALQIGVHPGIVIGRLQHDKHLHYNQLTHLKGKYEICLD